MVNSQARLTTKINCANKVIGQAWKVFFFKKYQIM